MIQAKSVFSIVCRMVLSMLSHTEKPDGEGHSCSSHCITAELRLPFFCANLAVRSFLTWHISSPWPHSYRRQLNEVQYSGSHIDK